MDKFTYRRYIILYCYTPKLLHLPLLSIFKITFLHFLTIFIIQIKLYRYIYRIAPFGNMMEAWLIVESSIPPKETVRPRHSLPSVLLQSLKIY